MDGIVVVARVEGIDGEEIEGAQVGAAGEARRLEILHLGQHGRRELVGDAVRVHGDQADLALVLRVAERLDDARRGHAVAMRAAELEAHEVAAAGGPLLAGRDRPFLELLAIDGVDEPAAAVRLGAEDADEAALLAGQALDRLGLVAVAEHVGIIEPRQPRQDALALAQRRLGRAASAAWGQHQHARARALACIPDDGLGDELAVRVAGDDLQGRDGWQVSALLEALAVAGEQALAGHLGQQRLEGDAVAALDGEGARDLALAGPGRSGAQIVEDVLLARQARVAAGWFGFAGHYRQ